ncbi:MAG: hypothetical protein H6Q71_805, partial [Firmicutes bacterium]|nr:hypothetical protein [Bacillota bacterium]
MSKVKTKFVCQQCGSEASKWLGRCPGCGEWNTMVEEVMVKKSETRLAGMPAAKP